MEQYFSTNIIFNFETQQTCLPSNVCAVLTPFSYRKLNTQTRKC